MSVLETGCQVELINADNLNSTALVEGAKGWVNSIAEIDGKEYIWFMPETEVKFYVIESSRVEVLEDGQHLTEDAIAKLVEGIGEEDA